MAQAELCDTKLDVTPSLECSEGFFLQEASSNMLPVQSVQLDF